MAILGNILCCPFKEVRHNPDGKTSTYFKTKIGFSSVREDLISLVAENFQGRVSAIRKPSPERLGFRVWSNNEASEALSFLESIEVYMPYHDDLARVMIDFLRVREQRKAEYQSGKNSDFIDEERVREDAELFDKVEAAQNRPLDTKIWLPPRSALAAMLDLGKLTIVENDDIYSPQAYVSLEHRGILKAIEQEYEGMMVDRGEKTAYWLGISRSAARFVRDVFPDLRLYRSQARLLLDFYDVLPYLSRKIKGVKLPELARVLGRYSTKDADLVELLRLGFRVRMNELNKGVLQED